MPGGEHQKEGEHNVTRIRQFSKLCRFPLFSFQNGRKEGREPGINICGSDFNFW
jgi:hypothetical protein